MSRPKHAMHLDAGSHVMSNNPIISYRNGYLWIGNDAPDDKRCFATMDEYKAIRMAKAILRRAGPVGKEEG